MPGAEITVAVGQEGQVVGVLLALPLVHDEGVVDRNADDVIDAVLPEFGRQLVVARHVRGRAGRGEGAGQREDDNGFTFEDVIAGTVYPVVIATGAESNLGDGLAAMIV